MSESDRILFTDLNLTPRVEKTISYRIKQNGMDPILVMAWWAELNSNDIFNSHISTYNA